jgi:hypothetical protein
VVNSRQIDRKRIRVIKERERERKSKNGKSARER